MERIMSEVETSTPEAAPTPNYGLLAKEAFGSNFHGDVQEPVETEQTETPEIEASPVEPTEEETPLEATEETTEATEEEGETTISSLTELLEAEGYDQEQFLNLEVEQKIDGETRRIKLSDVLATNQTLEAAERRLNEVKEKAKTQNQALANKGQELDQAFNVAAQVLQKQKLSFDDREKALNTDPLRTQDPAEWGARKQELSDQRKVFDSELRQFLSAHQQQTQSGKMQTEQAKQERLVKEQTLLLKELPEWADEKVMAKEQQQLGEYLHGQDLTPESYDFLTHDHKLLVMARKAAKYDEVQAKAEPAKKKLVSVPKTLKPGSKPSPLNSKQTEINGLEAKIAKNPNSRDALDWSTRLYQLRRGTT
jgi:hypothetical protein